VATSLLGRRDFCKQVVFSTNFEHASFPKTFGLIRTKNIRKLTELHIEVIESLAYDSCLCVPFMDIRFFRVRTMFSEVSVVLNDSR